MPSPPALRRAVRRRPGCPPVAGPLTCAFHHTPFPPTHRKGELMRMHRTRRGLAIAAGLALLAALPAVAATTAPAAERRSRASPTPRSSSAPTAAHRAGRGRLLEDLRRRRRRTSTTSTPTGGVHGRKITYKVMDDGYNPANTQQVVRQLVLAGQGLRAAQRPRHADAHRRARLPQDATGCRTCSSPPAAAAGTSRTSTRRRSASARLHGRGQDPRQLRRRRTSPARRSASSGRTTTSARDSLAGVEKVLGAGRGGEADVRHHQHQRRRRRSARSRRPAARSSCSATSPGLHRALRRHRPPGWASSRSGWSPTSAPTTRRWPSSSAPSSAAARGHGRRQLPADA